MKQNPALKSFYAERRNKKIKFALISLGAIVGMYAVVYVVWSIATYDFCPVYFGGMTCF